MKKKYPFLKKLIHLIFLFFSVIAFSQSVEVTDVSVTPICAGSTVTITFSATNGIGNNNKYDNSTFYDIYLINSSGSVDEIGSFQTSKVKYKKGSKKTTSNIKTTITIPITYPSGSGYKIAIKSSAPNSVASVASDPFDINSAPATPGKITGTITQFPALTGQTYSISAVPNATYNWTVPTGWTITAGQGTTAITVTTGSVGNNGNITVSAQNDCGKSESTLAVTVITSKIDFDGIDDYIDFGDNHDLTGNFTLEAWVLQESTTASGTRTIISKRDDLSTNKRGYHLILKNGKPNLTWYNNLGAIIININSSKSITNKKWYHIAASYDGTNAKLYVDGVLVKEKPTTTPPTNGTKKFLVGAMYDSSTPTTPKNNFNGYIDEVRVWDVALTAQQIHEMMNQRIIQYGLAVKGKTIPLDISGGLLWTNLIGYYPMSDGYTANDKSGNAVNGFPKNITTNQPNTAPLPYKSNAPGLWATPATWGDVQNIPNNIGIDIPPTPIDWNIVETSHNISSAGNKTLLGLIVNNSIITAGSDSKIEVSRYLKLNGIIDLQGRSQLVQTLNSDLEPTSAGYIKRNQQGVGNKNNYNYWSSPVGLIGEANNSNYSVAEVFKQGLAIKEGSYNTFVNTTNQDIHWIGGYDGKIDGGQIFLARYWLWKFENGKAYSNWVKIDEYSAIRPSQGFTVKGANAVKSGVQNYTFVGKPNNGRIALNSVLADNYFLVGNPYPSALDGKQFIIDNEQSITGTIYFWEQSSGNNTHLLAGYTGGYSTLSIVGGVAPSDPAAVGGGGPIKPDGIAGLGAGSYKVPKRFIPVGQGFFVIGKKGSGKQPIVFNNSQRGFHKEDSNESTYLFKNEASTKRKTQTNHFNDNSNDPIIDEKLAKIRLGFNTSDKFHRQLLLGFMNEKATDGEDYGYDAKQIGTRDNDMYFLINNSKYTIQGVGQFDVNKKYPLGVKATVGGDVQFTLDEILNLPSDVSINILDKLTGETHNISQKPFEINLEAGTYLDRFALTFKTQKLVAEDVKAEVLEPAVAQPIIEGIHVFMNNAIKELQIKNNSGEEILNVALINSLGQTVKTWNSNFNIRTISLPINTATGIYIVQIITKTGKTVRKISVE
jgi:hypothetical protein